MANPDRWTTLIENLDEYCDIWVRGAYPSWLSRPRTMLLYEYELWAKSRDKAKANGKNVNNLYFMLILESFKGPISDPVNYVPYEIIRFDAYASLILGSQGLTWWHGQEGRNPIRKTHCAARPSVRHTWKSPKQTPRKVKPAMAGTYHNRSFRSSRRSSLAARYGEA